MRHLLIEVDGGTVHMLVALLEGELHGDLDLAGLREPGAEAEDRDVDPVVEGEGGGDVHVAREQTALGPAHGGSFFYSNVTSVSHYRII